MAAVVVACKLVPGSDSALVRAAQRAEDELPTYPRPHAVNDAVAVRCIVQARALAARVAERHESEWFLLCTVITFPANPAHNLTRSPSYV